jgi:hypothetical protein
MTSGWSELLTNARRSITAVGRQTNPEAWLDLSVQMRHKIHVLVLVRVFQN